MFNIVLVEPEIPQNTGNIARTCAATGSVLHLVRPLGFSVTDKYLKRAGLDYWHLVKVQYYDSVEELKGRYDGSRFYYASTKGSKYYTGVGYKTGDFLVFGKETAGLPRKLLEQNKEFCIKIPMVKEVEARSLNLSNAVAIVLYEALRQQNFTNFK